MGGRKLGDFVHDLRIKKKESLRSAAKAMEISAMYLSEIESGKKIPSGKMIRKISDYYETYFFQLVNLGNESSVFDEKASKAAVARMVEGLSEDKLQKVIEYIQNIEGDNK